ncbi:MAG: hypothetical protein WBE51_17885, partial [Xanthobacteraceae bacterium]
IHAWHGWLGGNKSDSETQLERTDHCSIRLSIRRGLVSGNAELPRHGGRSWGDLDVVQAVSASGTLASDSKRDWCHRVEAADFLLARGVKLTIFFAVVAIGFA